MTMIMASDLENEEGDENGKWCTEWRLQLVFINGCYQVC